MDKNDRFTAVVERLNALEGERLRQQEARRKDSAALTSPLESGATFLAEFEARKSQVGRVLNEISTTASSSDSNSLKPKLDGLALELSSMEKLVADASYYLPSYAVQASQSSISKLKARLELALQEVVPKKKFSFRNKNNAGAAKSIKYSPETIKDRESINRVSEMINNQEVTKGGYSHQEVIKDRKNATIVHDSASSSSSEVMLSNLVSCQVYLCGRYSALFFHNLKDCKVYAGPVTGSILLEDICDKCCFMLASHQIRIHSTHDSDFYLRVRSRPIVEYVSNVRFAPYAFSYPGIEDDLRASNLEDETEMWDKVDDFRWLRATSSPNWSLIPLSQRLETVHFKTSS